MTNFMYNRALSVEPIDDMHLLIEFANKEKRVLDCHFLLHNAINKPLSDPAFFKQVHIDEVGVISWSDIIDIPPCEAYSRSTPFK